MTLITGEVYDYILDDIQRRAVRDQERMNDVIEHLKLQAESNTKVAQYIQKAEGVKALLQSAATQIDTLPALGADLEKLVNPEAEKTGPIIRLKEEAAIVKVGPRMTRGAMEKALLEEFEAESVSYDAVNDEYIIFQREEES